MNRTYYQQMGYRIKAIRMARGLTQAQLGDKVALSRLIIGLIERSGRTYLNDPRLSALAVALGVTVENVTADGWRDACGVS
jgi:transcriptional regulator with XRE-family HTH domain